MSDDKPGFRPPQVGSLLEKPEISKWIPRISRPLVLRTVQAGIEEARKAFLAGNQAGGGLGLEGLVARIGEACAAAERRKVLPVLNGTGIILHTNLGRSPLGQGIWDGCRAANEGYSSLEFDLGSGERGRRGDLARELCACLAGSEAALVLNNNAAAVLLALTTLAPGREVIVSRGEQVQIGGGFRIPDILALSGARLVEVGTTNVTRLSDYLDACGPETSAVLVVHRANFAMRGFVESPSLAELAAALPKDVLRIVDQGSGCLHPGLPGEIPVPRLIADGADLVCFSGDKLLGGPQAGIIVGRADLVSRLAAHPLARALRPGKTILSLLEETLIRTLNGEAGPTTLPDPALLAEAGRRIALLLPPGTVDLLPSTCALGGGSTPDETFPSFALEVSQGHTDALGGVDALQVRLREGRIPLIALVRDGRLRIDLAALIRAEPGRLEADTALVARLLSRALGVEEA